MNKGISDVNKLSKTRIVLCIELLKTFSEEELNRFDEFVNSSFFNTNKKLSLLFKKLRRYTLNIPEFTDEVRLKIYQDVYDKAQKQKQLTSTQKNLLSKALSSLLALAEKFIMVEQLEHNDATQYDLLFPELIKREQMLLYNRRLKAIQKELDNEQKKGVTYHTNLYKLHSLKENALFVENKLHKEDNYDDLQYYLDTKYLLEKFGHHLAKITQQNKYAHKKFNLAPFATLKNLINLPEYKSNPLIQMYSLSIDLIEKDEKATFNELSEVLKQNQYLIPTNTLRPFYKNLTNYCVEQITKGELSYFDHLFEIYKDMDRANLFVKDGVINLGLLKNIITIACRITAFNWAVEKLTFYIDYVPKIIRKDVFHYNRGIIAFNQNKYEEALANFMQVRKIDDTHDLNLRIVRLQSFYETDRQYEMYTQQMIHSLKVYVNDNKKLSQNHKTAYYNFISIFNKLYKFKDIPNKRERLNKIDMALPQIKKTVLNFDLLRDKQWLLAKIKTLENDGL